MPVTRFQRLELKYLIDEQSAERIRSDLAAYCEPDAHNPERSGRRHLADQQGYEIDSLYLDSPSLALHRAKERGDPERIKLRVRSYAATGPAILELKRKSADVISKTRVAVSRQHIEDAVSGLGRPLHDSPEARAFLAHFAELAARIGAEPKLLIHYEREAFASVVDEYARVTFDRKIRAKRVDHWDLSGHPERWHAFDERWLSHQRLPPVVLELKCETLVPRWISQLIRDHGLRRVSFSKYSLGTHVAGSADGSFEVAPRSARTLG